MATQDPNEKGYTRDDSKAETDATDKEQYQAWHDARDAFVNSYGDGQRSSLDPATNESGYEQAFGQVGGGLPDEE